MKEWLPAGTTIGRFQISSRISANGIGEVYQATEVSSGRELALKLLPASLIDDPQTRRRFIQIFSSVAQLSHHNFCQVYEAGIAEDGRPFVAMEYVKGQSLDLVSLNYRLPVAEITPIIIQIAEAFDGPHAQGWVHLTIKPADLMMTSDRHVKILDFGLGMAFPLSLSGAASASFSPDGRSLAAIRTNDAGSETSLWIGNETGEGAVLVNRLSPAAFHSTPPAWSPDGRVLVCAVREANSDLFLKLVAIEVGDKTENTIVSGRWSEIDQVAWRADGGGLIAAASDPITRRSQLWRIDYPSGAVSRVTQDWGDYRGASMTRDASALVSVQSEILSNVWIAPGAGGDQLRQVTTGRLDGLNGIAWTPDERLVYVSLTNGREGVWIGGQNGAEDGAEPQHRPLPTESGDGGQYHPTVSPDGRFITYVIERASGVYLLRNEIERKEFSPLANERLAFFPQFAPDGKWVIYSTIRSGRGVIAKVSSIGGEPETLIAGRAWRAVVSPDGTMIACNYLDETTAGWRLAVLPISGGAPMTVFDAPGSMHRVVQWTPDGAGLSFIVTRGGVSNIWSQPISGGAPAQLTNFKTDRIFNFAWSRYGQRLALAHGWESSDVALIRNFR